MIEDIDRTVRDDLVRDDLEDEDLFPFENSTKVKIEEESEEEDLSNSFMRFLKKLYTSFIYIVEIFNNRFGRLLIVSFIFFILGIFFWRFQIEIKTKEGAVMDFDLKYLFFFLWGSLLCFLGLSLLLYHSSYFALKHSFAFNSIFYYVNELSEHISLGLIILSSIVFLFIYQKNFCFSNMHGYDIYIGDVLNISLVSVFMFGGLKVWTKTISMNFNYQIYIERILRVLVENIFLTSLKMLAEPRSSSDFLFEKGSSIKINRSVLNKECGFSGNEILNICFSDLKSKMSTRRILLKEFQKFCRNKPVDYELPIDHDILDQRNRDSANYIADLIKNRSKLKNLNSFSVYLENPNDIKHLEKILGIPSNVKFDSENLFMVFNRISREKYFLLQNLEQMNAAIDRVALVFKMVIIILCGIMLYIKVSKEFAATATIISAIFGTQFISHSFSSNAINSMIFLFFIHPYDIGDRVFIQIDNKTENLVVSELNVFSTVFFRWDGTCVYVPNAVLSGKLICNVRRSGTMGESHKIQINARTNQRKLNKLRCCIEDFVKGQSLIYTEYIMMNYEFIENSNKLHMKIYMQYKDNWQDYNSYLKHKTVFLSFLNRTLQSLEIEYALPPQRVVLKNIVEDA
ncbi:Mechanosensitive ion channel protein 10 [Nosema granulosis]|uniref:Mechanosensitive ion channel protein 10 n=1 Tax=Nosema granulosis TaxID=83296 RepID=A0A9P6GYZ3_9MICR|nr:Mechanosensitive ion channel protein 10 [Nosema granulosis]